MAASGGMIEVEGLLASLHLVDFSQTLRSGIEPRNRAQVRWLSASSVKLEKQQGGYQERQVRAIDRERAASPATGPLRINRAHAHLSNKVLGGGARSPMEVVGRQRLSSAANRWPRDHLLEPATARQNDFGTSMGEGANRVRLQAAGKSPSATTARRDSCDSGSRWHQRSYRRAPG